MTILNRLREASTGSRELDAEIGKFASANNARIIPLHELTRAIHNSPFWVGGASSKGYYLPPYTTSIDAALALVERMLPGWVVADLSQDASRAGNPWGCGLAYYNGSNPSLNRYAESRYDYAAPPIPILIALFTALEKEKDCAKII